MIECHVYVRSEVLEMLFFGKFCVQIVFKLDMLLSRLLLWLLKLKFHCVD